MKVPQEENTTLDGQKKVMYVKSEHGDFNKKQYGSKVEEYATKIAVQEYDILEKEALQAIQSGEASPIQYFMYKNRMDLPTLSSCVGIMSFRVKRHLKMKYFKKLNRRILQRYAEVFDIEIAQLTDFSHE